MGSKSPEIRLPNPVEHGTKDEDENDEIANDGNVSFQFTTPVRGSSVDALNLISNIIQKHQGLANENDDNSTTSTSRGVSTSPGGVSPLSVDATKSTSRTELVEEEDDETRPNEFEAILNKKSELFLSLLNSIDANERSVKLAKQLVEADERITRLLSNMRQERESALSADANNETAAADDAIFEDAAFFSEDPRDLCGLMLTSNENYFEKDGRIYKHDPRAYVVVDSEFHKFNVLQALMNDAVMKYDVQYKQLRERFRDIFLTNSKTGSKSEAMLPCEWIQKLSSSCGATHFNARAFIKDCKIGKLEKQKIGLDNENADVQALANSLHEFVKSRQQRIETIGRHCLFDFTKTDDVVRRFVRESGDTNVDMTLVFHKLAVLLAKDCVLLRLIINYAYPNLAMLLSLIETYEMVDQRRLLSPFFPPVNLDHLQRQVIDMGIVDDECLQLTGIYLPRATQRPTTTDVKPLRFSTLLGLNSKM